MAAPAAPHNVLVDLRWREERFSERFEVPESLKLFNPGVVKVKDRRDESNVFGIFVARGHDHPYGGWDGDNHLFARLGKFTERGVEWRSKLKKVDLSGAFVYGDAGGARPTSFEDVRLGVSPDHKELYFVGNMKLEGQRTRRMAVLTVDTYELERRMRQVVPDIIPVPFVDTGDRRTHNGVVPWLDEALNDYEKNWSFFTHFPEPPKPGQPPCPFAGTPTSCVIRNMDTMQVYTVTADAGDPSKRLCDFAHFSALPTENGMLNALEQRHRFKNPILRGGTPGIRWDTNMTLFVGHAVKEDDGQLNAHAGPMASGADGEYFRRYPLQYFFFFVVVKYENGVFKLDKMSKFFRPRDPARRPTKIIFPTGLESARDDPYVHLFFGYEDGECRMVSYKKHEEVRDKFLMPMGEFAARVGSPRIFGGDW